MKKPLISVIVPIYRVEQYIRECIDSIINQTYKNLEIILVDDGSPDRCPQICDEYAKKDSRIKVIHKKNGGLSDARNAGLEVSHGEYFCFVDSDDFLHKNYVEKLYLSIVENDADLALCGYYKVYDAVPKEESEGEVHVHTEHLLKLLFKIYCAVSAWNKLYKKEVYGDLRYPVGKIHEDEFVSHIVFNKAKKIVYLESKYYYYRLRQDSIMGKSQNKYYSSDAYEAKLEKLRYFQAGDFPEKSFLINSTIIWIVKMLLEDLERAKKENDKNKIKNTKKQLKAIKAQSCFSFNYYWQIFKLNKFYNIMKKPLKFILGKQK